MTTVLAGVLLVLCSTWGGDSSRRGGWIEPPTAPTGEPRPRPSAEEVERTVATVAESSSRAPGHKGLHVQVWSLPDDRAADQASLTVQGRPLPPVLGEGSRFDLAGLPAGAELQFGGPGLFPVTMDLRQVLGLEPVDGTRRVGLHASGSLEFCARDEERREVAGVFVEVQLVDAASGGWVSEPPRPWPLFVRADVDEDRPTSRFVLCSETDESGRFVVPELPCGRRLRVRATRDGHVERREVTIDAASRRARVDLSFPSSTRVFGSLVWSTGGPASGVLVRLASADLAAGASLVHPSDDQGRFEFASASRGRKRLSVLSPGETERFIEVVGETLDLGQFVLERPARFVGRLIARCGSRGVGLGGAEVSVRRGGQVLDRARTDEQGRFTIRSAQSDAAIEVRVLGRGALRHDFAPPLTDEVELRLDGGTGALRLAGLTSESGCIAELVPLAGGSTLRLLCQGEQFGVEAAAGDDVTLHLIPRGAYSVSVHRPDGARAWIPEVEVVEGADTAVEGLVFGRGRVVGLVEDASGQPLPGVSISLEDRTGTGEPRPRRTISVDGGRFAFEDVGPGQWRAVVSAVEAERGAGVEFEVRPDSVAEVRLSHRGTGTLRGRIEGLVAGASPALRVLPSGASWFPEPVVVQELREDGAFGPYVLPAGRYLLATSYRNAAGRLVEHWRDARVRAGLDERVEFEIAVAVPLRVTFDGVSVEDVSDGYVFFPGGQTTVTRATTIGSVPVADLATGPWLVAVRRAADLDRSSARLQRGFSFASCEGPLPPHGELQVELDSGVLVVECGDRPELAGQVTCEVNGFADLIPAGTRLPVRGHVPEAGLAVFDSLPIGARVRVRGPDGELGSTSASLELESRTTRLRWPPGDS